jgi:hypothetical protein
LYKKLFCLLEKNYFGILHNSYSGKQIVMWFYDGIAVFIQSFDPQFVQPNNSFKIKHNIHIN